MKLVIVGCGGMGWYQAKKFQALGAQIVGAIDHNEDHLRGFCENFGVEESYKSLDMISRFSAKADALSCCLPDCFHTLCCEAAVRANLALFCEKPLTATKEEADLLARLPRSRPFMVNFSKRHTPSHCSAGGSLSWFAWHAGECHHLLPAELVQESCLGRPRGGFSLEVETAKRIQSGWLPL